MGILDRDPESLFQDDKTFDLDGIGQQKGVENLDDELDSLLEHSAPSSPLSSNADTATSDSDAGKYPNPSYHSWTQISQGTARKCTARSFLILRLTFSFDR